MNSNTKKAGRPKGPEKEMFRAYVEPWQKVILLTQVDKFKSGATRPVGSGGIPCDSKPLEQGMAVDVAKEEGSPSKGREGVVLGGEVEKLKKDNWALLEENERLGLRVRDLEDAARIAAEEVATDDGAYWKAEYQKVAKKLAAIENMSQG